MSALQDILETNAEFIKHLVNALSMGGNPLGALPSVIFLVSSMLLVHHVTHRKRFVRGNTWKHTTFRELIFQWGYYYVTRLWLWFMKALKWTELYCEILVKDNYPEKNALLESLVYVAFFSFYMMVALVPFIVLLNDYCNQPTMPNFIVWGRRWERTEMGTAGYYLDRPLRMTSPFNSTPYYRLHSLQMPSYRARRSCSAEHAVILREINSTENRGISQRPRLRVARSMEYLSPTSSFNEII